MLVKFIVVAENSQGSPVGICGKSRGVTRAKKFVRAQIFDLRARNAQKILRTRAQKFSCCSKKNNTLLKFEQQLCTKYQINGLKINSVVMYKVFNEFLIPYYTLPTLTNQNGFGIMQRFLRARSRSRIFFLRAPSPL